VIGAGGVFVVDAKLYAGTIRVRDVGGLFKRDERLYVGRRDCSGLAENMKWQVEAIEDALGRAKVEPVPPITPVLSSVVSGRCSSRLTPIAVSDSKDRAPSRS
jgi:hypothetical protein